MIKKRFSLVQNVVIILILIILITACDGETPTPTAIPEPPIVDLVLNPNISDVVVGQIVSLAANATGKGLTFKWTVTGGGSLSAVDTPVVNYTAPDTPGVDTVTVEVNSDSGTTIKHVSFNVVANTETDTVPPDPPIACNSPAVTNDVFPHFNQVAKQFSFYGPLTEARFDCDAVFDIFHNGPVAVHINYESFNENSGFWGIGVPTDSPFAINNYREICFWAYVQKPRQSFLLRMKDTSPKEDGITITIQDRDIWTQICTDLTKFSGLGIQLDRLENINLGFNKDTDNSEIWVDDFEFIE